MDIVCRASDDNSLCSKISLKGTEGHSVLGDFRIVNSWNNKSVRWQSSNNLPEVKNTALYQAVKKLIWGIFSIIREYKYSPFL